MSPTKNNINVVLVVEDENYKYALVSLISILENTSCIIDVCILYEGTKLHDFASYLYKLKLKYKNLQAKIFEIDSKELLASRRYQLSIYTLVLLPILQSELIKYIYINVGTVVEQDVNVVYKRPFEKKSLGIEFVESSNGTNNIFLINNGLMVRKSLWILALNMLIKDPTLSMWELLVHLAQEKKLKFQRKIKILVKQDVVNKNKRIDFRNNHLYSDKFWFYARQSDVYEAILYEYLFLVRLSQGAFESLHLGRQLYLSIQKVSLFKKYVIFSIEKVDNIRVVRAFGLIPVLKIKITNKFIEICLFSCRIKLFRITLIER